MKKVIPFFIIITIITISLVTILFIYNNHSKVDTVLYNDIINSVEHDSENKYDFDVNYFVLYNNASLKYSNFNHKQFTSLDEYLNYAYLNNYIILDFSNGKIFIENSNDKFTSNLIILLTIYFIITILLIVIFLIYLNKTIFSPFKKLKSFASDVALGNLDSPILMEKNNPFGAFTESFDIMRHELNESKKREVLLEKAKKELVASLSHDIKTPISSIKAVSELLVLTETNPKKIKNLEIILKKSNEIDVLTTNMFNVTLQELSELKVNSTIISSMEIVEMIKETDIFELIKEVNIPECLVFADKLRLKQILGNIINNSYKYANTLIKLEAKIKQNAIDISFTDYGSGVYDEELYLLTSKFYRGKNAIKESGSGLGLYICKVILDKMDGMIECLNVPNGFTVKITLKLA